MDCLSTVQLLKSLNPPVGVQFETDNIYTLDNSGRMLLTILASVAEESHTKSEIMEWSVRNRFGEGNFLTPELLGYDLDDDGNLVVNEKEAETVTEIANLLRRYKRKTKYGSIEWNPSNLADIIANERRCGDIVAQKTYTPDFLTHKAKKNNGEIQQYRKITTKLLFLERYMKRPITFMHPVLMQERQDPCPC